MTAGILIGIVVGAAVGLTVGVAVFSGRARQSAAEARVAGTAWAEAAVVRQRIEDELRTSTQEMRTLEVEGARLAEQLISERRVAEQRCVDQEEARRRSADEFARLSAEALAANNEQFMTLADARLQEARQAAVGDLTQRHQAIEQLVAPLREQLGKYEEGLVALERHRQDAYRGLLGQVEQLTSSQERLQRETRNLSTAMRSPAARGRWGELQLRKVVEMAGMLEHCDFEVQVHAASDTGRLRPDLVAHLPGGKQVVVDAKVPLEAFQLAVDADSEDERRTAYVAHARQVRAHVDALSKKEYWRQFDRSPEFVVAFVPGDPLLAAAFEHDPGLIEHAVANDVLLATPTTLISLLRAVAYGWQQEALTENARAVQQLGRQLYDRLATLGGHLGKLGRSLTSSVEAYNSAVGSIETRVMVTARQFPELGVGSGDRPIPEAEPVVALAREVQTPELLAEGRGVLAGVPEQLMDAPPPVPSWARERREAAAE